jgi:hypothetical protein
MILNGTKSMEEIERAAQIDLLMNRIKQNWLPALKKKEAVLAQEQKKRSCNKEKAEGIKEKMKKMKRCS